MLVVAVVCVSHVMMLASTCGAALAAYVRHTSDRPPTRILPCRYYPSADRRFAPAGLRLRGGSAGAEVRAGEAGGPGEALPSKKEIKRQRKLMLLAERKRARKLREKQKRQEMSALRALQAQNMSAADRVVCVCVCVCSLSRILLCRRVCLL